MVLCYDVVTSGKEVIIIKKKIFFCHKGDEKSTELRYVGIFSERGKEVAVDDGFYYALWRVLSSDEEMKNFTEWYFSGDWIVEEVTVEE